MGGRGSENYRYYIPGTKENRRSLYIGNATKLVDEIRMAREHDAAVSSPSQISTMPEADQQMTIHESHPHLLGECRSRLTGSSLRVTADIDPRSEVVFIAENGDELEVIDAKSVRMR